MSVSKSSQRLLSEKLPLTHSASRGKHIMHTHALSSVPSCRVPSIEVCIEKNKVFPLYLQHAEVGVEVRGDSLLAKPSMHVWPSLSVASLWQATH